MGLGGRVRERRDVWTLSREDEWHEDILWYERGIAELQRIVDVADPRSWANLANIHGTYTPRDRWPAGSTDRTWTQCQHASWFFLPWHRIYLHHFEKIVRAAVVGLGGPAAWSLPFWDYDPARPETLALPPAFRQLRTPPDDAGNRRDNALYVARRRPGINDGDPIDSDDVETTGWVRRFTARSSSVTNFGGPKSGWAFFGPAFGQLEREPHGLVHVAVGGDDGDPRTGGLMTFPRLAARDPIFWLHHANIDRLWEVWRNAGNRNTRDRDWLREEFTFGSGSWTTTMKVEDVADTTAAPLLYRYEGVPVPEVPARRVVAAEEAGPPDEETIPELVAASETETPVSERKTVRAKRRKARARRAASEGRGGRRVFLTLENVVAGRGAAGRYAVHVNLPEGEDPYEHRELRAGKISTFGLEEYPGTDDAHEGGATFSFDITDIVARLEARGDWEADDVRVTVTPRGAKGRRAEAALRIGRVGVYYE